jgi:hypothetical protein
VILFALFGDSTVTSRRPPSLTATGLPPLSSHSAPMSRLLRIAAGILYGHRRKIPQNRCRFGTNSHLGLRFAHRA